MENEYESFWREGAENLTQRHRDTEISAEKNARKVGPTIFVLLLAACAGPANTLTISVAASLERAMQEIAPAFEKLNPQVKIRLNFGGSGALARQIEQGAPADVLIAAAPKPMDELAGKGLIRADSRRDLLRNQIVLVVPRDSPGPNSFSALKEPSVKVVALGDPASVPAGDYGKQALVALGLWSAVESKLVLAKDVRQVLGYVETGNADAGLVYTTDAHGSQKVRIAATAPPDSHAAVVYPVAVLKSTRNEPAARAFVDFLSSAQARAIFQRHGFEL